MLPTLFHEGVELLHEEVPKRSLLTMLGDVRPKSRKAKHLSLGVVGLDQPVSVEEGAVALLEYYLLLLS